MSFVNDPIASADPVQAIETVQDCGVPLTPKGNGPLTERNVAGHVKRKRDGKRAKGEWIPTKDGRLMPKSPGRPKGSLSAMKTLTTELLSDNGVKVAEKIIKIALDDSHPQQMKALLFAGERIFPTDVFAKGAKGSQGVQIQIIGTDGTTINATSVGHSEALEQDDEEEQ